jgi:hypothetical protein
MRRIIYLGYYLKNLDTQKFRKFLRFVRAEKKISLTKLLFDVIVSSMKYNISFLEYFQFRFYKIDQVTKKTWAGTGYMYEFQRIMNPPKSRVFLDDKTLFYRKYGQLIRHKVSDITDLQANFEISEAILTNPSGKIVFKVADGKCGINVLIRRSEDFDINTITSFMKEEGYDLIEEYIIQHPDFMKLSPTAVNTIRIFTQLDANGEVEILGCRLRISVNSKVDNMAAGNIAAPVDEITGTVTGPGVYSDITKPDEAVHPITGVSIIGFRIPFWKETISMAKAAAKLHPQNRSIGWDIAMTDYGPDLIEGNHDWCKLLWQLPVKQGLKPILERHLIEYQIKGFEKII